MFRVERKEKLQVTVFERVIEFIIGYGDGESSGDDARLCLAFDREEEEQERMQELIVCERVERQASVR